MKHRGVEDGWPQHGTDDRGIHENPTQPASLSHAPNSGAAGERGREAYRRARHRLLRDLEALGVYKALGIPDGTVETLKGPRVDIIRTINLGRPIPIADGSTGDVITIDAAIDAGFPNGRRLGGGSAANRHQVNVNTVLLSLIAAGNPSAGLAKGVETNDKNFLNRFPFLAPAHQGLFQGHGGTNATPVPEIPPVQ